MAPAPNRLAIDLSGDLIRILEGALGGAMKCGSSSAHYGALAAGKVNDPQAVGQAIKQLLARSEVTETRAIVAVSDSLATFRVLHLPAESSDQTVEIAVSRELPQEPERLVVRWIDVQARSDKRVVYAVAYDRQLVKNITDGVAAAGVSPSVVELKSAALARVVSAPACVVVDLSTNPMEIVLIDQSIPRLWHSGGASQPFTAESADQLAGPLRSVVRFYSRAPAGDFGPASPVYVSCEQALPDQMLTRLGQLVEQPVQILPAPPRVAPNVRVSTYLTCLGLIMRRTS